MTREMRLIEKVAAICRRLARHGWANLLACHGLQLDCRTLDDPQRLKAELRRPLKVDRTMPGFEDFWRDPEGDQAVRPGRPARSLLYHALASPLVHPGPPDKTPLSAYPTLLDIDTIENYIYASRYPSLKELTPSKDSGAFLVVGVFAYQYRIGARSPNGKFASTALSRTGIARVGTAARNYDPMRRSHWPLPENSQKGFAAMPARYAAYLAELRTPGPEDAILDEQPGDEDRNFLFPVHKLFDGDECLKGRTIRVRFAERHINEKLRKFHTETGIPRVAGFDIEKTPFVRDSQYERDLVKLERVGSSVLVVPVPHPTLARLAMQQNSQTKRNEIARFVVPSAFGENRFAGSSFQFLDAEHAERRPAPEYINIRHKVIDPEAPGKIKNLNTLGSKKFNKTVRKGRYEAAHFVDDSCEGCVVAKVSGIPIAELNKTNFPAFSMIAAPDFFPLVDQADVNDWVEEVLGTGGEREHFAQGGPWPLSGRRTCINPKLLVPGTRPVPAFPVRDELYKTYARIENVTAIVGGKIQDATTPRPSKDLRRFGDPSTSFLSDGASGIFDPGWDVSLSGSSQYDADFLASYGLGSPFPEDVKLCSALNSFWPSVTPDATRTFALSAPDATTSVPLMDDELGLHPRRMDLRARKLAAHPGWDGEYGPFFVRDFQFVNYARIEQSDYVSHAIAGEISLARLAPINAIEMFGRMTAIRDAIAVLPEKPPRVSATPLVLITAERVADWAARSDRADPRLAGDGFLFVFALLAEKEKTAKEHGRGLRKVKKRYTCQISRTGMCWKRESPGESFQFKPRARDTNGRVR
jgi:hypothetical protein